MRQTKEISFAPPGTFDVTVKEGEELRLTEDLPKQKSMEERIAELEKQIQKLKVSSGKD